MRCALSCRRANIRRLDKLSPQFGPWGRLHPDQAASSIASAAVSALTWGSMPYFADQLRHGSVDVRLDPGGTMVQAEVRQTRQEDTT